MIATGSMDNTVSNARARPVHAVALLIQRRLGQVRLWDPKTGNALGEALKGHQKWITSLAWEPVHL